jgi:hypothetical protein
MCDYSLQTVRSRPANVGEKLRTRHFNTGTIGFAAPEDANMAVCVLPGTELAFATPVRCSGRGLFALKPKVLVQSSWRYLPTTRDMNQTCVTWEIAGEVVKNGERCSAPLPETVGPTSRRSGAIAIDQAGNIRLRHAR